MRWIQYICSLKYAMNLFILIEFGKDTRGDWPDDAHRGALEIIETNDITPGEGYLYVIILFLIIIAFRALSTTLLARRAAAFF